MGFLVSDTPLRLRPHPSFIIALARLRMEIIRPVRRAICALLEAQPPGPPR